MCDEAAGGCGARHVIVNRTVVVQAVDRSLLFAIVWSIGASLSVDHWGAFDSLIRRHAESEKLDVGLPSQGQCFDLYLR